MHLDVGVMYRGIMRGKRRWGEVTFVHPRESASRARRLDLRSVSRDFCNIGSGRTAGAWFPFAGAVI